MYPLLSAHGPQDSALVLELVLDSDPVVVDPYEKAHGKGESVMGPLVSWMYGNHLKWPWSLGSGHKLTALTL